MSSSNKLKISLISTLVLLLPNFTLAGVFISEINWTGNRESSANEWIELHNNGETAADLEDWSLISEDETPEINLSGKIPPQGYFLMERTNDQTVKNKTADLIYTGSLSNQGEELKLKNKQGELIDYLDCREGWFAGDNENHKTMERTNFQSQDASSWQTGARKGGTPKSKNNTATSTREQEQTKSPVSSGPKEPTDKNTNQAPVAKAVSKVTAATNQKIILDGSDSYDPDGKNLSFTWNLGNGLVKTGQKINYKYEYPGSYIATLEVSDGTLSDLAVIKINIYNDSITISEFMPNPEGSDKDNEWIELYNRSDKIADLSNWQIDDKKEGSGAFIIPQNTLIGPKQFLVIKRKASGIALNNNGDRVRLLYPDGTLAAQIDYSKSRESHAVAKKGNEYFWTEQPTPSSENIISLTAAQSNPNGTSAADYYKALKPINEKSNQISNNINHVKNTASKKHGLLSVKPLIAQAKTPHKSDLTRIEKNENETKITQKNHNKNQTKENSNSKPQKNLASAFNPNQPELILILSILISGGLLSGWLILLIKR